MQFIKWESTHYQDELRWTSSIAKALPFTRLIDGPPPRRKSTPQDLRSPFQEPRIKFNVVFSIVTYGHRVATKRLHHQEMHVNASQIVCLLFFHTGEGSRSSPQSDARNFPLVPVRRYLSPLSIVERRHTRRVHCSSQNMERRSHKTKRESAVWIPFRPFEAFRQLEPNSSEGITCNHIRAAEY